VVKKKGLWAKKIYKSLKTMKDSNLETISNKHIKYEL